MKVSPVVLAVVKNVLIVVGITGVGVAGVMIASVITGLSQSAEIYIEEPYKTAAIKVDVSQPQGEVHPVWAAVAQGGEEIGVNMLDGTQGYLQTLKPKYIRLDHLFDDDYYHVVKRVDGKLQTDWSALDRVVNSITASGATPFFSLTYMPQALAANKTDMPVSWDEWQWLVKDLMLHYSGKSGKNISGIYYEVWNEPDLETFGKWQYRGQKNYLTLYAKTAQVAAQVTASGTAQAFKIGGPATTGLYKNWVLALIDSTEKQKLPLDFISWHRYAAEPQAFAQDLKEVTSWLRTKKAYELIISEWGPTPEKSDEYAGYEAASHAVAVARQMIEGITQSFVFELKDGPGQEKTGWGLLTHSTSDIRPKPRFQSLVFLQDMVGERLALSGEGTNVTGWAVGDTDQVRVVLTNYGVPTSQEEKVPIEFTHIPAGTYLLKWVNLQGPVGERVVRSDSSSAMINQTVTLHPHEVLKVSLIRKPQSENVENTIKDATLSSKLRQLKIIE